MLMKIGLKVEEQNSGRKKSEGMANLHRAIVGHSVSMAYTHTLFYLYTTMPCFCQLLVTE